MLPACIERVYLSIILACLADIKSGNVHSYSEAHNMLNDDSEKVKLLREAMYQLTKIVDSSVSLR